MPPGMEERSPNHWTAREFLKIFLEWIHCLSSLLHLLAPSRPSPLTGIITFSCFCSSYPQTPTFLSNFPLHTESRVIQLKLKSHHVPPVIKTLQRPCPHLVHGQRWNPDIPQPPITSLTSTLPSSVLSSHSGQHPGSQHTWPCLSYLRPFVLGLFLEHVIDGFWPLIFFTSLQVSRCGPLTPSWNCFCSCISWCHVLIFFFFCPFVPGRFLSDACVSSISSVHPLHVGISQVFMKVLFSPFSSPWSELTDSWIHQPKSFP